MSYLMHANLWTPLSSSYLGGRGRVVRACLKAVWIKVCSVQDIKRIQHQLCQEVLKKGFLSSQTPAEDKNIPLYVTALETWPTGFNCPGKISAEEAAARRSYHDMDVTSFLGKQKRQVFLNNCIYLVFQM